MRSFKHDKTFTSFTWKQSDPSSRAPEKQGKKKTTITNLWSHVIPNQTTESHFIFNHDSYRSF